MPEEGVEPTHSCLYGILSPARLPVPPLRPELLRISANVPEVPPFHGSTVGFRVFQSSVASKGGFRYQRLEHRNSETLELNPLEPWNRGTVEPWNCGTVQAFYRLVPVHVPVQLPPENVPFIDRRSEESVALNV